MVDQSDLVVQEFWVGLIEKDALLHDRLIVLVRRHAGRIERARSFQVSRLDLEHIEAAVVVLVDPFADGIAHEARLDLLRPIAPVRVNAAMGVVRVIDQDIGDLRQHHDFHRAIERHHGRHARRQAFDARQPIALVALGLFGEACLQNLLVFDRERRPLSRSPGLGRVERRLATDAEPHRHPLARKIRISCIVKGLNGHGRRQQRRHQRGRADRIPIKHGLPLVMKDGVHKIHRFGGPTEGRRAGARPAPLLHPSPSSGREGRAKRRRVGLFGV
jgi:hypothetical protein